MSLFRIQLLIDNAALGLLFLRLICLKETISWKEEDALFHMAKIDRQEHSWLPLVYHLDSQDRYYVKSSFTEAGQKALHRAKEIYGNSVVDFILTLILPIENRPTIETIYANFKTIKELT